MIFYNKIYNNWFNKLLLTLIRVPDIILLFTIYNFSC